MVPASAPPEVATSSSSTKNAAATVRQAPSRAPSSPAARAKATVTVSPSAAERISTSRASRSSSTPSSAAPASSAAASAESATVGRAASASGRKKPPAPRATLTASEIRPITALAAATRPKPRMASDKNVPCGGRCCSSASAASTGSAPAQNRVASAQERIDAASAAPASGQDSTRSASPIACSAWSGCRSPNAASSSEAAQSTGRRPSRVPARSSSALPKASSGLREAARRPSRTAWFARNMTGPTSAPLPQPGCTPAPRRRSGGGLSRGHRRP